MIDADFKSIIHWYFQIIVYFHKTAYLKIWNNFRASWVVCYLLLIENNFVFEIAVELPKPSQSHYMVLDDRSRSRVIADASPLSTEQISEYASLNLDTRSWEIPREHVTIKQIVGKGSFGQVAKATVVNLQGRSEKTLVAVKMLKGTKK